MRLLRLSVLCAIIPLLISSRGAYRDQRIKDRETVKRQYSSDLERKEEILRMIQSFINDVNGRLGKHSKTRIVNPVNPDYIENANETEHYHTSERIPSREFVYVNAEGVLRVEGNAHSTAIGRLRSGERVELLGRSKDLDSVDGFRDYWYMIKNRQSTPWRCSRSYMLLSKGPVRITYPRRSAIPYAWMNPYR